MANWTVIYVDPQTLQRLIHLWIPAWDDSILKARQAVGFSPDTRLQETWEWLAAGNHAQIHTLAAQEVTKLDMPEELASYWRCCFFSDYIKPDGAKDLSAISGPPFLQIACPSDLLGAEWTKSVARGRSQAETPVYAASALVIDQGYRELGQMAIEEVQRLGLPEPYMAAWLCCSLPPERRRSAHSGLAAIGLTTGKPMSWIQSPDDWNDFRCPYLEATRRHRAYPTGIDWGQPPETNGMAALDEESQKMPRKQSSWPSVLRGIQFEIHSGKDRATMLWMGWNPAFVDISDLRYAVEHYQREYGRREVERTGDVLTRLLRDHIHQAKQPHYARLESGLRRYGSGEASFEQLLIEEALQPDTQDEWNSFCNSTASPQRRVRKQRELLGRVYDRVRRRLVTAGHRPRLAHRLPSWHEDLFPEP